VNSWNTPVKITVDRGNQTLDVGTFARIPEGQGSTLQYGPYDPVAGLPPGKIAVLFLAGRVVPKPVESAPTPVIERKPIPCPEGVVPAVQDESSIAGSGKGQAFHIQTDAPINAYQMFPYGGGSTALTSATLLLPTNVWDTNYIAVNAFRSPEATRPTLALVALEDGTEITLGSRVAIDGGGGIAPSPANQTTTYTANRGDYIQLTQSRPYTTKTTKGYVEREVTGTASELTGSIIKSNKPVGMFGGAGCLNFPAGKDACDHAHQQIPPIRALGHEYVAVRYRDRKPDQNESVPWRFVGAVDGTQLTYLPSAPPGAPATLGAGDIADFDAPGPFVVQSQDAQHVFYAAGYMTGGNDFNGEGDPDWINLLPPAQFVPSYLFFTDPTFPQTNLVVIRTKDAAGQFADVTLDCAGTLSGWQDLGNYQYTRVDLVTGNFENVGTCSNGRHEMKSAAPFGLTVWGWGSSATGALNTKWVSYAYPAGGLVQTVNTVVVEPTSILR